METNTESSKLRKQRDMSETTEKDKVQEKILMKKVSNSPDKELKVMVIKMLTKIGKRIDELEKEKMQKYTKEKSKS